MDQHLKTLVSQYGNWSLHQGLIQLFKEWDESGLPPTVQVECLNNQPEYDELAHGVFRVNGTVIAQFHMYTADMCPNPEYALVASQAIKRTSPNIKCLYIIPTEKVRTAVLKQVEIASALVVVSERPPSDDMMLVREWLSKLPEDESSVSKFFSYSLQLSLLAEDIVCYTFNEGAAFLYKAHVLPTKRRIVPGGKTTINTFGYSPYIVSTHMLTPGLSENTVQYPNVLKSMFTLAQMYPVSSVLKAHQRELPLIEEVESIAVHRHFAKDIMSEEPIEPICTTQTCHTVAEVVTTLSNVRYDVKKQLSLYNEIYRTADEMRLPSDVQQLVEQIGKYVKGRVEVDPLWKELCHYETMKRLEKQQAAPNLPGKDRIDFVSGKYSHLLSKELYEKGQSEDAQSLCELTYRKLTKDDIGKAEVAVLVTFDTLAMDIEAAVRAKKPGFQVGSLTFTSFSPGIKDRTYTAGTLTFTRSQLMEHGLEPHSFQSITGADLKDLKDDSVECVTHYGSVRKALDEVKVANTCAISDRASSLSKFLTLCSLMTTFVSKAQA